MCLDECAASIFYLASYATMLIQYMNAVLCMRKERGQKEAQLEPSFSCLCWSQAWLTMCFLAICFQC